ncbi:FUSC family protein [Microbacterium aquimaris]|uniref:FUSC family protein n=1 Tax=Microbacterium aquimaris TaxID=459816 RepID=A0ABU5N4C6_9MICO|nr:FUSC family protein [Microbacterium aquimaris]MDZ8160905.1 FUSC family protein [Microbacterium aquimaris]
MSTRGALTSAFAAQDPAHARLVNAVAVTAGMLLSALFGQFVIHTFHAETGLLAMAIFLSVQAGGMVKDATARGRLLTTALLIPTLVAAVATAAFLSTHGPLVIVGFILIAGAAIWSRRFGARAAAIGSLGFMGYFFTLFMRPSAEELPAFALVAVGAAAAQTVVRTALLITHPRRELKVLLRELRAGSAVALRVSGTAVPGRGVDANTRALRSALRRLDQVGRAITSWQHRFQTDRHVDVGDQTLAQWVLDARVDTEEACAERARQGDRPAPDSAALDLRARGESALEVILDDRAASHRVQAARDVAVDLIAQCQTSIVDVETYLLARCALSHVRLRGIDIARGRHRTPVRTPVGAEHPGTVEHPMAADSPRPATPKAAPATPPRPKMRWTAWRSWEPTTRMAVQAMIAAALAAGVGDAISASRWYWAVMTAFVIFLGATTRSGIFTRAYRRVAGTIIGIGIGVGAVTLVAGETSLLVAIAVVAVFGMLYFGPLNYLYASVFITTMLVSLYRMLGVLDGSLLELRLVETLSGALIGVLCAYLILSTNSRSVLLGKADAYFETLEYLLRAVREGHVTDRAELMATLQKVEDAQTDLAQAVASMSAALAIGGPGGSHLQTDEVRLTGIATRGAARFAQARIRALEEPSRGTAVDDTVDVVVAQIVPAAQAMRAVLGEAAEPGVGPMDPLSADRRSDASPVIDHLRELPSDSPASRDAVFALARIDWALRRIVGRASGLREPRSRRRRAVDAGVAVG